MRTNNVIAYVPEDMPDPRMGPVRKGLWLYTNKLGLNFSFVLSISLAYQFFVSAFIGVVALAHLPLLQNLLDMGGLWAVIAMVIGVAVACVVQSLIIAEMAQIVWLRTPDRLKVRLMSNSGWWWAMVLVLGLSVIVDFFLLFLAVTGQNSVAEAIAYTKKNQTVLLTIVLLMGLNVLTLLRCSSVMRTTTRDEIKREIQEHLESIAQEMLLDAGDSAREKAKKVWGRLSINPEEFVPIHDSIIGQMRAQFPDLFPNEVVGPNWAYDFGSNSLVRVPMDVHNALMRTKKRRLTKSDVEPIWKMPPSDIAAGMAFNIESYGAPKVVDASNTEQIKFINEKALPEPGQTSQEPANAPTSAREKQLFAGYLQREIYPQLYKQQWAEGTGISVFEVFDPVEQQYHYRQWKQGLTTHTP